MQQSWRWFGPTVPVPLDYIRQAAHADGLLKANPGCTVLVASKASPQSVEPSRLSRICAAARTEALFISPV